MFAYREAFEECARRETLEETGLQLQKVIFHTVVNAVWPDEKYHYVIIVTSAQIDARFQSEPQNTEPHKCEGTVKRENLAEINFH